MYWLNIFYFPRHSLTHTNLQSLHANKKTAATTTTATAIAVFIFSHDDELFNSPKNTPCCRIVLKHGFYKAIYWNTHKHSYMTTHETLKIYENDLMMSTYI